MSDSDRKRKPEPSTDVPSSQAVKRRKVSNQEQELVASVKRLETTLESIASILDGAKGRFIPPAFLETQVNKTIPEEIGLVLEPGEPLYSFISLGVFSLPLRLPTNFKGLERGMLLSVHFFRY